MKPLLLVILGTVAVENRAVAKTIDAPDGGVAKAVEVTGKTSDSSTKGSVKPPPLAGSHSAPVRAYADLDLRFQGGKLLFVRVVRGTFPRPTTLRRYRGRFEAQARRGAQLLEAARFDFPLLAEAETDDVEAEARKAASSIRGAVNANTTVRVPLPEGCDAIVVVDDKTGAQVVVDLKNAK